MLLLKVLRNQVVEHLVHSLVGRVAQFASVRIDGKVPAGLTGKADLMGAWLPGADLLRVQLQEANLITAHLQKANLYGAQLQKADLRAAQLQNANLDTAQLQNANLEQRLWFELV